MEMHVELVGGGLPCFDSVRQAERPPDSSPGAVLLRSLPDERDITRKQEQRRPMRAEPRSAFRSDPADTPLLL